MNQGHPGTDLGQAGTDPRQPGPDQGQPGTEQGQPGTSGIIGKIPKNVLLPKKNIFIYSGKKFIVSVLLSALVWKFSVTCMQDIFMTKSLRIFFVRTIIDFVRGIWDFFIRRDLVFGLTLIEKNFFCCRLRNHIV